MQIVETGLSLVGRTERCDGFAVVRWDYGRVR